MRLLRWRLKLEKYDYEAVYKPESRNTNADALSRINMREVNSADEIDKSVPTEEGEKKKTYRSFSITDRRAFGNGKNF